MDKFKKLEQIVNLVESDKITRTEFSQLFSNFVTVVRELKTNIESKIDNSTTENNNSIKEIAYSLSELELTIKNLVNTSERSSLTKIKDLSQSLFKEISRVESLIPETKDFTQEISNLESMINAIPPQVPQIEETGESIVDKINSIEDDSAEAKIDASHIRNLPKSVERIVERIGGASMVRVLNNGAVIGDTVTEINFTNATSVTYTGGATGRRANITTGASGSGGGSLAFQTLTGTIDGSNKTFTFSSAIAGQSIIDLNGQLLIQDTDYTISGTTVTYVTAPPSNGGIDTHVLISGGGAVASVTSVNNEIVLGSGTTYTLANTPTAGSVRVFINRARAYPTTDYTISGAVITTTTSHSAGDLLSDYTY